MDDVLQPESETAYDNCGKTNLRATGRTSGNRNVFYAMVHQMPFLTLPSESIGIVGWGSSSGSGSAKMGEVEKSEVKVSIIEY